MKPATLNVRLPCCNVRPAVRKSKPKEKTGHPEIGARLKAAREAQGLTRKELAEAVGRDPDYIAQLELAYNSPATDLWMTLAPILDENLDFLVLGTRPGSPGLVESRLAEAIELLTNTRSGVLTAVIELLRAAEKSK